MKITKLNCASCGAPLTIPEDTDVIVCPSCHSTLSIERSEGYVTLKVMEKLAETIKENAFVTQVELRRMQLSQMVSMEEMKLNTLQTEIRAAKRRTGNPTILRNELSELLLQENDIRMHIRTLKADIAQLDPGWEESLEVIKRDGALLDEALNILMPYAYLPAVQNRIDRMKKEKIKCDARYNKLEATLLQRELQAIDYPPVGQLTLEEMEELQEKIPSDLKYLNSKEQTSVNLQIKRELHAKLDWISQHYPRMKVESQAGELSSLDLKGPYPEEPEKLQKLVDQVKADLTKLSEIPSCPEKDQFAKLLHEKLDILTDRIKKDIPAQRAKKKKRRLILAFSIIGALAACVIVAVIVGAISLGGIESESAIDHVENFIASNLDEESVSSTTSEGEYENQYEEYTISYVEVTSSVTYLRDEPSIDANSFYEVVQGDILISIYEESLSDQWYKVSTFDGSTTGYLAVDWIMPITVNSVPGNQLTSEFSSDLYTFDFSSENSYWPEETYDDAYGRGSSTYVSGAFVIDITSTDDYIYSYTNQEIGDLPEEYLFSLTMEVNSLSEYAYYGIQTNVIDESNFDAVLISSGGTIYILRVRNGYFNILYDTGTSINGMVDLNLDGGNVLAMARMIDPAGDSVTYHYAINGKVFSEIIISEEVEWGTMMGAFIYLDQTGDSANILVDDFIVKQ